MRTVEWNLQTPSLNLIDQRLLPEQFTLFVCWSCEDVEEAIRHMVVRGAPAIGAAAAFGLVLAAMQHASLSPAALQAEIHRSANALEATRPTAVNLKWAIQRMLAISSQEFRSGEELAQQMLAEAQKIADEDVRSNLQIAEYGCNLIDDGDTILHHCNTGALATVDWGTALGVIRMAHEKGKKVRVLVDETRPRLQGARLTAWELQRYGIPYEIISDGAAGHFMHTGQVQKVLFGADRVAANGDVANKVGTYMVALAASANHIPVFSVFPTSTVDLGTAIGDQIPIEERDPAEVLDIQINGVRVTPAGARAKNPAFDITPHNLLSGLVTEKGIIYPPFAENLARLLGG
jgi:methylthioribose-1-phosphate isomerase